MTTLAVTTTTSLFGTNGSAMVTDGDRTVASVEMHAHGWLARQVRWSWAEMSGPAWTMAVQRGDRMYEVRRADDAAVGRLERPFGSSRMTLTTIDGEVAELAARRIFERVRVLTLPDGTTATYERCTPTFTFSRAEQWRITFDDALAGPMRTLVLAVVLALDHRRRRQEQGGTTGGAA